MSELKDEIQVNIPNSLRKACIDKWQLGVELRTNRKAMITGSDIHWQILAPVVVCGIICAVAMFLQTEEKVATSETISFLLTMWQVHAAVAGAGIVLLAFIFQTVTVKNRTRRELAQLSREALLIPTVLFGLASTVSHGFILGLVIIKHSAIVSSTFLACTLFLLNGIGVGLSLWKSMYVLDTDHLKKLFIQMTRDEVDQYILEALITGYGAKYLADNSRALSIGDYFAFRKLKDPHGYNLCAHKDGAIEDFDLEYLTKKVSPGKVYLFAQIGDVVESGQTILFIETSVAYRKAVQKAVKIGKRTKPDCKEITRLTSELADAVQNGDRLSIEEIFKCLNALLADIARAWKSHESVGSIDQLMPVDLILENLSPTFEHCIALGRRDLGLFVRSAHYQLISNAFQNQSLRLFTRLIHLSRLLRNKVLLSGNLNDPVLGEVYWWPVAEFTKYNIVWGRGNSGVDIHEWHNAVVGLWHEMMAESIHDGANDMPQLIEAWFKSMDLHDDREGAFSIRSMSSRAFWIDLAAWAIFLHSRTNVRRPLTDQVIELISQQFASQHELWEALIDMVENDGKSSRLESWMLREFPDRGMAHIIDAYRWRTLASISIFLKRWKIESPRFLRPKRAGSAYHYIVPVLEQLKSDPSVSDIIDVKGIPEAQVISQIKQMLEDAKRSEDEEEEERFRSAPLEQKRIDDFRNKVVIQVTENCAFTPEDSLLSLKGAVDELPRKDHVLIHTLVPRRWFIQSNLHLGSIPEQFSRNLLEGEMRIHIDNLRLQYKDTRSISKPNVKWLERFCKKVRHGVLFVNRQCFKTWELWEFGPSVFQSRPGLNWCVGILHGVRLYHFEEREGELIAAYFPDGLSLCRYGTSEPRGLEFSLTELSDDEIKELCDSRIAEDKSLSEVSLFREYKGSCRLKISLASKLACDSAYFFKSSGYADKRTS